MDDPNLTALATDVRRLVDAEAVRMLMARYHSACDGTLATGTHSDPDAIAALFAEDGEWLIPGNPAVGRKAISAMARRLASAIAEIVHFVANPVVDVDGDRARGEFKGIVRSRSAPGAEPRWSLGRYRLAAARVDGAWLIRSLDWEYLETPEAGENIAARLATSARAAA